MCAVGLAACNNAGMRTRSLLPLCRTVATDATAAPHSLPPAPCSPLPPQLFVTEEESCYGVKGDNKQKKCCQDKEEQGVWDWFCDKVSGGCQVLVE